MSPIVAIDGPAGSGKSTISKAVAAELGLELLDTGAMYRAVTLLVLEAGLDPGDGEAAAELARQMSLELGDEVVLNGRVVTDEIRSPRVDAAVSLVAADPGVRAELVRRQRAWGADHGGGVVEGRDIGSVVFPDADLKVYLTADAAERARRRVDQRQQAAAELAHTAAALERRDSLDSNRAMSPLEVAEGAIVVDSTHMTVAQVVKEVLSHL